MVSKPHTPTWFDLRPWLLAAGGDRVREAAAAAAHNTAGPAGSLLALETAGAAGAAAAMVVASTDVQRCTCNCCGAEFESVEEQRRHFSGIWHAVNVRRSMRNKPPLDEQEVTLRMAESSTGGAASGAAGADSPIVIGGAAVTTAAATADVADIADSSSGDSDSSDDEAPLAERTPRVVVAVGAKLATVWRAVLPDPAAVRTGADVPLEHLLCVRPTDTWLVLLFRSGHFAGIVAQAGKVIAHKAFHRYTTRRKQGGAQSTRDSSGGRIRSGGSMIRRHNEIALQAEITETLQEWQPYIEVATRIFVSASKRTMGVFYEEGSPLVRGDARVRGVPFVTRRPTMQEATSAYRTLMSVEIEDEGDALKSTGGALQPVAEDAAGEMEEQLVLTVDEAAERLRAMCASGTSVDQIVSLCEAYPVVLTTLSSGNVAGNTALHCASRSGSHAVVTHLLQLGAPADARNLEGRTPFEVAANEDTRRAFQKAGADKTSTAAGATPAKSGKKTRRRKNKGNKKNAGSRVTETDTKDSGSDKEDDDDDDDLLQAALAETAALQAAADARLSDLQAQESMFTRISKVAATLGMDTEDLLIRVSGDSDTLAAIEGAIDAGLTPNEVRMSMGIGLAARMS